MVGGILDVDHCDLKERDQTVTPHVFSPIWCVLLWRWLPSWSSELFNVHRPTHKKKVVQLKGSSSVASLLSSSFLPLAQALP
ncbi:unnamed protein product [Allacma fusca]|uniref:Uncharacterized protein n=1 Tax=Allacma fusca TaxID=39272 RepID=A0A8J2K5W6_9HEXA|nr:unnamed protein product [Allacma fusca]